jgi:hypothetical protein
LAAVGQIKQYKVMQLKWTKKRFSCDYSRLRVEGSFFVRPRRSWGLQLGEAQKDLLLWMKYTTLIAKKAEHPEGINTIFIIPIFLQLSPGLYGSCIFIFILN